MDRNNKESNRSRSKNNPFWYVGAIAGFLKLGKFGGVLLSMIVSIGVYALISPWQFALGFVLLILVHELGHVLAAKMRGLPVTAPVFIPFIGALINMKRNPSDAETEAFVGLGGPLLGSFGAFIVYLLALHFNSQMLMGIAYAGFFINLINLLPIHPLDGGRISVAVSRWLWIVGLIGGLAIIVYLKSILFFIIWVLFAYDLYIRYIKNKGKGPTKEVSVRFEVPLHHVEEQGLMIPGEAHRRPLPFATYSEMDGTQKVEIGWESMGLRGTINMPEQGLVQNAEVVKVEKKEDQQLLLVSIVIRYEKHENEEYYEVPLKTRWIYGTVYGLLAVVLLYYVYQIHQFNITH